MPAIARSSRASPLQRSVCWLSIMGLIFAGSPSLAVPAGGTNPDAIAADLRAKASDLSGRFEKDTLLDAHDYDAQSIIDFVTGEVSFQAYDGVLRGLEGTLAGRSGNAHDQALTLATMLRDAGYDAQILVGSLTEPQARELVHAVASPVHMPHGNDAAPVGSLERAIATARRVGRPPDDLLEEANANAESLTGKLISVLGRGNLLAQAIESSRTYRWVRYREGAADPWVEIHPAYPAAREWQLEFDSVEAEGIEPADLQTVEIEVWIENSDDERHSVTGVWRAPAASLMGEPLTLELLSDAALRQSAAGDIEALVEDSEFFFVQLNGVLPAEGKLFDLHGDVLSGTAMEGLDSIFSTANRRVRRAIDTLGTSAGDETQNADVERKQLTRVWIEFRLISPNDHTERVERVIFEGQALEERPGSAARLIQRWDVDVVGVTPLPEYYQARSATGFALALDGFGRLQRYLEEPGVPTLSEFGRRAAKWMGNPAQARLVYLRQMFDQLQPPESVVSYPSGPNLLAVRQGLIREAGGWLRYEMADILSNPRVSLRRSGDTVEEAFDATIARGVWETKAEAFRPVAIDGAARSSAYEALVEVAAQDLKRETAQDGIRLVASGADAWWQVNPTSGSIIGMRHSPAGTGGQATDYLTALTLGISAVFFGIGTNSCVKATSNIECCFATNLSISVVGFALGFSAGLVGLALLGKSGGLAVGASTSVLADLGLQNAPTFCS